FFSLSPRSAALMLINGHLTFLGRGKQAVGGYTNTTRMSISRVAQHPLRNPQVQQPDRHA
ncbi:hypothetical protein, partial [Mycobacterium sp.]|uniref:hypothetical protein n=1 Tax=Mycobacterium sp. TaxID=1785 RepID=UPI003BAFB52A